MVHFVHVLIVVTIIMSSTINAQRPKSKSPPAEGHAYRYEGEGTSQFSFTEMGKDKNGDFLIEQMGFPRVGLRSDGTTGEIVDHKGRYSYTDDQGRHVVVTYTADATGYHPVVKITPA